MRLGFPADKRRGPAPIQCGREGSALVGCLNLKRYATFQVLPPKLCPGSTRGCRLNITSATARCAQRDRDAEAENVVAVSQRCKGSPGRVAEEPVKLAVLFRVPSWASHLPSRVRCPRGFVLPATELCVGRLLLVGLLPSRH